MKTTTMILSLVVTLSIASTSFAGESLSASCNKVTKLMSPKKVEPVRKVANKKGVSRSVKKQ